MITRKPEQLFQDAEGTTTRTPTSDGRESYDTRLSRILGAATTVIAREGYQRASMRAVSRASEVSLAGLYHYFASKEQMLFLIQFRTFSSLLGNLREKLHGVRVPIEQLRVMIRAHVAYFAANIAALKVCSHELDMLSGDAYRQTRAIRQEYYTQTLEIIEAVLKTGAPASAHDAHVATMSLFGTLNWLYRWYDPKKGPSPNALAKQITDQFLTGLINENKTEHEEQ
jgi:AcrR family transcriptional regulator